MYHENCAPRSKMRIWFIQMFRTSLGNKLYCTLNEYNSRLNCLPRPFIFYELLHSFWWSKIKRILFLVQIVVYMIIWKELDQKLDRIIVMEQYLGVLLVFWIFCFAFGKTKNNSRVHDWKMHTILYDFCVLFISRSYGLALYIHKRFHSV